ncbi:MAG: TonB-dependent receptor [Saprospiraceae bacterium]|nr:TonB-dependent receptor [Saprospiraceae bacterium]
MKNIYLYIFTFLFSVASINAQTIQGIVKDDANNPLSGAHILNISSSSHAHTNDAGYFQIENTNLGDSLQISFIGFELIEVVVKKTDLENPVQIVLKEDFFQLEQVNIVQSVSSLNQVASIDLQTNPVTNAQEILRRVPGLMIAQHAGGGKAEQIFLRGFDIDHGTDIQITVDGMPVNMVSHAHGQGYADLHFLIPETIQEIDFGKGPYYARQGNFNTAGYVNFETKDALKNSTIGFDYGQFNTSRLLGMFNLFENNAQNDAYVAAAYTLTDGPFESPQNFNRLNLMGKYTHRFNENDRLSVQISRFQSKWDASGQIPQRLVDDGTITRFGAVDDTEGGQTSRTNVNLTYVKSLGMNRLVKTRLFYSQYDFELFSNFTFFLEDPVNGDQIRQFEDRAIYGLQSEIVDELMIGNRRLGLNYGVGLRYDNVDDNELSRTANRKTTLEQLALGDIDETNLYGFLNAELELGDWLINPALRVDAFSFDYIDRLTTEYTSLSEDAIRLSPKLNILYNPTRSLQLYLKSGLGFHSNDTRVVVRQGAEETLPFAAGSDLGFIWKPSPRIWINAAAWYLYLEQEFVYVGDAAVVEPSGETQRMGIDFGVRLQLSRHLFFDGDINYTYARAINEPEGEDFIPLAPDLTSMGGLTLKYPNGFSGGIRYRYIKDRPANEDNSIVALGYFIVDANANYTFNNLTLGVSIENLFDEEWNEAQFATESRLRGEDESVEEIHFTPGVPFFARASLRYNF